MNAFLLSGLGSSWPQCSAFYDSKMLNNTFLDEDIYIKGYNYKKEDNKKRIIKRNEKNY